jgi:hypothetical protein
MHTVYTNNSSAAEFFKQKTDLPFTIKWVSASAMEVLVAVHAAVKKGARLVSNPLVGANLPSRQASAKNARPPLFPTKPPPAIFNPYLTVITTPTDDSLDFTSLKKVDDALAIYKKNAKLRFIAHNDDAIAHFQMIDLRSMLQAMSLLIPNG